MELIGPGLRPTGMLRRFLSVAFAAGLIVVAAPLPPANPSPPPIGLLLAIGAALVLVGISALAFGRGPRSAV